MPEHTDTVAVTFTVREDSDQSLQSEQAIEEEFERKSTEQNGADADVVQKVEDLR